MECFKILKYGKHGHVRNKCPDGATSGKTKTPSLMLVMSLSLWEMMIFS